MVRKELVILPFKYCNIFVMFCTVLSFPPGVWVGILNLIVQSLCLLLLFSNGPLCTSHL